MLIVTIKCIRLCGVLLCVGVLSVIMLIAVMLIITIVSVVAPFKVMVQTTNCSLLKVKNTFERVLKNTKKTVTNNYTKTFYGCNKFRTVVS
jgi:hypothetical protein